METLTDEAVRQALGALPGWNRQGDALCATVTAPSFSDAMALVNQVAGLAEAHNHHPDMDIRYRTVTFRLTTHQHRGLTHRDVTLAQAMQPLLIPVQP